MLARHLSRAYGYELSDRRMSRLVDRAVASYGRYWAESLRLPRLGARQLDAGIHYDHYEHIAAGVAAGRGTILALPHLGGWEWAGTHLVSTGLRLSVVVERLEPADLFEWFVRLRTRLGMNVIPAGPGAAASCAQALADNQVLCLLADRLIEGASGAEVEFFGEKTQLPAGPATLALRTGARLVPAAVYFEPETDRHLGALLPPIDTARARGRRLRDEVQRATQDMADAFESFIRRDPTQWHLMQPNWPSDTSTLE